MICSTTLRYLNLILYLDNIFYLDSYIFILPWLTFLSIRTNTVQNMGTFQQRKRCPNTNKVFDDNLIVVLIWLKTNEVIIVKLPKSCQNREIARNKCSELISNRKRNSLAINWSAYMSFIIEFLYSMLEENPFLTLLWHKCLRSFWRALLRDMIGCCPTSANQ